MSASSRASDKRIKFSQSEVRNKIGKRQFKFMHFAFLHLQKLILYSKFYILCMSTGADADQAGGSQRSETEGKQDAGFIRSYSTAGS